MTCTTPKCRRKAHAHGLCDACYRRERYANDPAVREAKAARELERYHAAKRLPQLLDGLRERVRAVDECAAAHLAMGAK